MITFDIFQIQGAIIVSSLFQVAIGFMGLIGFLLRFIGPLTVAPTITLIGISLANVAAARAGERWIINLLSLHLAWFADGWRSSAQVSGRPRAVWKSG